MRSVNIKGVEIAVNLAGTNGCCGARSLQDFAVQGNDSLLTEDERMYLYVDLYRKLRDVSSHIWTAIDADPFAENSGWTAGTGSSRKGEVMSLLNMCRAVGFEEVQSGWNPNTGNKLVIFTDVWCVSKKENRGVPDLPDIKIDKPASTSVEVLADYIIAQLGE